MTPDQKALVEAREAEWQEPKYRFEAGRVINRASGEAIPLDEPVMVFRGRDHHAAWMIGRYLSVITDPDHRVAVEARLAQFEDFASDNPARMREPDTDLLAAPAPPPKDEDGPLAPGWLARDCAKAAARVEEWKAPKDGLALDREEIVNVLAVYFLNKKALHDCADAILALTPKPNPAAVSVEVKEALEAARQQFAFYARQHRAKGTADANAKALVNDGMVAEMDRALNALAAGEG